MGNLTSSLTVRLNDDVSGPAARAAGALRGLGGAGDSLKRLAASSPEAARLIRQLEQLQAQADKIKAFRESVRRAGDLGDTYRASRNDVSRLTTDLVAAKARAESLKGVRTSAENPDAEANRIAAGRKVRLIERDLRAATASIEANKAAYLEHGTVVRTAQAAVVESVGPLRNLRTAEAGIATATAEANAALGKQPAIMAAATQRAERLATAGRDLARGMGAAGREQERVIANSRRMAEGMSEPARAAARARANAIEAAANERERARVRREERRVHAERDLPRRMAEAGRRQGEETASSRRVADGMSEPARAAARTQSIAVEAAAARREEARVKRRAERREALDLVAGAAGVTVGHKVKTGAKHSLETYREFDKERRFGKAVMGLTDEEQKPLVDQAIHMGATSKYNDIQVLESQRELAARGLNKEQVMGLIEPAKDLGQSLDLRLPDAVKQMEGALFGFKKDMSTLEAAKASAAQTADLQVKAAKVSGMTPEDITQAYKYGATPARMSGVSEEMLLAFAGISKKANMGGDESGVAFRALIAATTSPTRKGKEAMLANGLDFKDYQRNRESLELEPFVKNIAAQYGVKLDDDTQAGLKKIFTNKETIADPAKFAPAVSELLGETLGGDDAKSKKSIAGAATRYRDASVEKVDNNAFIADLMKKLPGNLQLANAVFGSKQGSRIATALGDPKVVEHLLDELQNHSEGYAGKISAERMAGFDGAVSRFEGAVKNLESRIGASWDNEGKGGILTGLTDTVGHVVQSLAELPSGAIKAGTALAALGGVAATAWGGFRILKTMMGFGGATASAAALTASSVALDGSAAALTAAAARLGLGGGIPGVPAVPGAPAAAPAVAPVVTAGAVAGGAILATGVIAGALLDSATPGTGNAVGALFGQETHAQAVAKYQREYRTADAMAAAAPLPSTWDGSPERKLPGGINPSAPVSTMIPSSRGAVMEFLFGKESVPVALPNAQAVPTPGAPATSTKAGAVEAVAAAPAASSPVLPPSPPLASPRPVTKAEAASKVGETGPAAREVVKRAVEQGVVARRDPVRDLASPVEAASDSAPAHTGRPAQAMPSIDTVATAPVPDAGKIAEATAQLASYREAIAGIKAEMASIENSGNPDLLGGLGALSARKAEIESLISGVEARLQALGATSIAPKVDTSSLDAVGQKVGEARDQLTSINSVTVAPQVSTGGLDGMIAKARELLGLLAQLPGATAAANASLASVRPGGSSSAGGVRQAAALNHSAG